MFPNDLKLVGRQNRPFFKSYQSLGPIAFNLHNCAFDDSMCKQKVCVTELLNFKKLKH